MGGKLRFCMSWWHVYNNSFNLLCDFIASGQIRGMHYTHIDTLGEAQKAAFIDGYDIRNDFFMMEKSRGI